MANVDTQTNAKRLQSCTREHRDVVEAIRARDGDAARDAVRAHLDALTDSLLKRIAYR
jgi:DNA-binding GntR family transcriptional regulator